MEKGGVLGNVGEGAKRIELERRRQVLVEGWSPEHDDHHESGSIALVAALYAAPMPLFVNNLGYLRDPWPWGKCDDKRGKHSRIRQLEKAGAMIAAEIERLIRLARRLALVSRSQGEHFDNWYKTLQIFAEINGCSHLISENAEDHRDSYDDNNTVSDEYWAQHEAACEEG